MPVRGPLLLLLVLIAPTSGCGRVAFDELEGLDAHDANQPLAIAPVVARINVSSQIALVASGGNPPYTFSRTVGGGRIDAMTGVFRAPRYPGGATLSVTDTEGVVATAEIQFGGDALYVAGGFVSGTAISTVWRSFDGATWDVIGQLPAPRGGGVFVVLDDRMLYAGGAAATEGTRFAQVWSSVDGVTWLKIGDLPQARSDAAGGVLDDTLWILGGRVPGDEYNTAILTSRDGVEWREEVPLSVGLHGSETAIIDDTLWLVAGHDAAGATAAIQNRASDGTWSPRGNTPAAGEYHAVTVYQGQLWVAGGTGLTDRVVTTADGSTWTDRARLPLARSFAQLIEWQAAVWVVLGAPATTLRSVDGATWASMGSFPSLVETGGIVQFTAL